MEPTIRRATESDGEALTRISFASKAVWNYPQEYFQIWHNELTITPTYIRDNLVYVVEVEKEAAGYASVVHVKESFLAGEVPVQAGHWLEHMFVLPQYIHSGIGSRLTAHIRRECHSRGIGELRIFADPHAGGFYEKMGARYLGESPSSIPGRTVSLYILQTQPSV